MRIGHFAPNIWARGGIATYVRRVGEAQTAAGQEVVYLSSDRSSPEGHANTVRVADAADLFRQARELDLDILHLHRPVSMLPDDRVVTVRTMHGNQGSCPTGTRFLARHNCPCDRDYSVSGCLRGHYVDRCGSRRPERVFGAFQNFRREVDLAQRLQTVTVSRFLRERMIRSGCAPEKLHVIPSPAPTVHRPYGPPPRGAAPRFLFAGRIVPQKGLGWLLRALCRTSDAIHLDVAGDGHEREQMMALSTRLGLDGRVTFHGWVDGEKMEGLVASARAVVVPSIWHEPAGLVSLEAAAHGRAVIASRVGGIPEYATEDYALLVAPGDVLGLASALETLAGDASLADRLGRAGVVAAESSFGMGAFLQRLDSFYELSLGDRVAVAG
jgi:glycosyltransferase involved in cell wall biosynthesis